MNRLQSEWLTCTDNTCTKISTHILIYVNYVYVAFIEISCICICKSSYISIYKLFNIYIYVIVFSILYIWKDFYYLFCQTFLCGKGEGCILVWLYIYRCVCICKLFYGFLVLCARFSCGFMVSVLCPVADGWICLWLNDKRLLLGRMWIRHVSPTIPLSKSNCSISVIIDQWKIFNNFRITFIYYCY